MKAAALTIALLLLASNALAEPQEWMKKENPDELGTYISVSRACPRIEAIRIVEGALARAGIRPLESSQSRELFLFVQVSCLEIPSGSYSYHIDVSWGRIDSDHVYLYFESRLQWTAVGISLDILVSLKDVVEDAIIDYLRSQL